MFHASALKFFIQVEKPSTWGIQICQTGIRTVLEQME